MNRLARVFPARMDAFPHVAAFIGEACVAAGFGRDDCHRVTLVVEELFTNTVVHGHGGDTDLPVHLTLEPRPGRIAVTYEDTARPFDLIAALAPVRAAAHAGERPVGGLGLALVAGLAQELAYAHAEGRNRVSLIVVSRPRP